MGLALAEGLISVNLTAQSIAMLQLGPRQTDRIWFDDAVPGFGLRVRHGGSRAWIFQYKIGKKQRRLVIGQASAIKPAQAREIAGQHHARVKLGHDPAAEKQMRVERAAHTLGALVERYLAYQKSKLRRGSYREIARHLTSHAASLHDLPIDAVDQRTIAGRLNVIERNSGAVTSNRVRATMSAMFSWAMKEGEALNNPVANTNKRDERSRERVLGDAELRRVWEALADDQYGTIVKVLMLTGQRVNEIAGLRWSELDFDRDIVSLPGARTKNGLPHDVPMAVSVKELLGGQSKTDGRDFVFGKGAGPFSGLSRCKERLDARIAERTGAIEPWVHHDLRRSVATGMANIGIQPHIIEAVLNHVSGHKAGVAGIYNRATYAREKAQALARWDEHIKSIVGNRQSNVASLKKSA
jgi:integrase